MSGNNVNSIPVYGHAATIAVAAATPGAAVSTQIIAFTGTPARGQYTSMPFGTTAVAPVAASGNWMNIVTTANEGTIFKMNKRGIYAVRLYATGTAADTGPGQIGITLDCLAASYLVATALTPAAVGLVDLANADGLAALTTNYSCVGTIHITDAAAGGAQPAAVAGLQGVGCVRFHISNGAGAVVGTAIDVTSIRASIARVNDLAG